MNPIVSVVVPTYNSGEFLEETLKSLLDQNYENYTVTVLDNCSTDNSVEIANRFSEENENFHVVVNETNIGGEQNFNKALSLGTGKYIAVYHSDDVYEKEMISSSVKFLEENEAGAVSTLGKIINENSIETGYRYFIPEELVSLNRNVFSFNELYRSVLLHGNAFLLCPSVMFKKETYDKLGGFEFDKFRSSSDLGLWLKIAKNVGFGVLDKSLIRYRVHSNQGSQKLIRTNPKFPDILKPVRAFHSPDVNQREYLSFLNRQIILTYIRRVRAGKFSFGKTIRGIIFKNLSKIGPFNEVMSYPKFYFGFFTAALFGKLKMRLPI